MCRVRRILERMPVVRGNDDVDTMRSGRKGWKRHDPVESRFASPGILERSDDIGARLSVEVGNIDALRMVDNCYERGCRATTHGQRPAAHVKRPGLRHFYEIDGTRRLRTVQAERLDVNGSGRRCRTLCVTRIRSVRRDYYWWGSNVVLSTFCEPIHRSAGDENDGEGDGIDPRLRRRHSLRLQREKGDGEDDGCKNSDEGRHDR